MSAERGTSPAETALKKRGQTFIPPPMQNLGTSGGTFSLLDQTGHFALIDDITRRQVIEWRNSLTIGEKTEFRTIRSNITELLGIGTLLEVDEVFNDPARMAETKIYANRTFATKYGIEGSDEFIKTRIEELLGFADAARSRVAREIRAPGFVEQTNEVRGTDNLVDLLRLHLRGGDARIRFEAALKLEGIKFAAIHEKKEIDEKVRRKLEFEIAKAKLIREGKDPNEAKEGTEGSFLELQEFLDSFVFKSDKTGGEPTILISHHSSDNFATESVSRLPRKQAAFVMHRRPPKGSRYTTIKERSFEYKGRTVPIYATPRLKEPVSSMLKLYRKGTVNAEGAVEDGLGVLAVLENAADIDAFIDKLTLGAREAGIRLEIDELEDTLSGGHYSAKNAGSSAEFRAMKFLATIGSMKAEFLIFDHQAYVDNLYRDNVSHKEVQARRIFTSGVAEHFFPQSIYGLDHKKQFKYVVNQIRREMRLGISVD